MTRPLMTAEHARAMLELIGPGDHGGMRELLDAYRTVVALHEMLAGRDRPPTFAEVKAHETNGGAWFLSLPTGGQLAVPHGVWIGTDGERMRVDTQSGGYKTREIQPTTGERWWAWNNGIVAWPEVAK